MRHSLLGFVILLGVGVTLPPAEGGRYDGIYGTRSRAEKQGRSPFVSLHLAKTVCRQQRLYGRSGQIQSPIKTRTESGSKHGCGWYRRNPDSRTYDAIDCKEAGEYNTGSEDKKDFCDQRDQRDWLGPTYNRKTPRDGCPITNFPPDLTLKQIDYNNWAGQIKAAKMWVTTPRTVQDIILAVNWAGENNFKIRAMGRRHNWSPLLVSNEDDQKDCSNVVLIDMTVNINKIEMNSSCSAGQPTYVKIEAGATFDDLVEFMAERNCGLKAMIQIGNTTIGGVMAVAGHGEGVPPGEGPDVKRIDYGSFSNIIVEFKAVVWDRDGYALKTFKRTDPDAQYMITHLGRTLVTEVTIIVEQNFNINLQSLMDIPAEDLFGNPNSDCFKPNRSIAHFLNTYGRMKTDHFTHTSGVWQRNWIFSPTKPEDAREVNKPYPYEFPCNRILEYIAPSVGNDTSVTPLMMTAVYTSARTGLRATQTGNIWSGGHNTFRVIIDPPRPYDVALTLTSFAILIERHKLQEHVNRLWVKFQELILDYKIRNEFPVNAPFEVRVTSLDYVNSDLPAGSESPALSPITPLPDRPELNTAMWITIGSFYWTHKYGEIIQTYEKFLLDMFPNEAGSPGVIRPEWSKGYASNGEHLWSDPGAIRKFRKSFPKWNEAVACFKKYDKKNIYWNYFLHLLMDE